MDLTATHSDAPSKDDFDPPRTRDFRAVALWHGGWALAVLIAGVALWFAAPWVSGTGLALVLGLIPALAALALRDRDSPRVRTGLLALWALAAWLACLLTGGVSSPLAVWCLTPATAAVVLGGSRRLAWGAVLSVLAAAAAAVAQAAGWTAPTPTGVLAFGLSLIGLSTTAVSLSAGLLVAARRAPAAALASSIGDAETLLDSLPYLALVLSRDGQVERLFGTPPFGVDLEALRAGGLAAVVDFADRPEVDQVLAEAERDGTAGRRVRTTAETSLTIDVGLLRPGHFTTILRDSTPETARESALEAARADAEALNIGKSRFLANMSHELRTPLNAIMGFSDMMRERIFGPLPPKYIEYADLIHDAGRHLLDLINDVLDMSKIEAAKYELALETLDAREPISAALRLMRLQADDAGVQLRGVLPAEALEVDADRRALKQIALNLISNALKFTPKGGLVTVTLQALDDAMELTVADTGVGIAAGDLERLGRPYEQAGDASSQSKGTGLGLSLVRAFAELHGGEMVIESRLGEGTAVFVRLPVLAAPMPAAAEPPDEPPSGGAQVIAFSPQR